MNTGSQPFVFWRVIGSNFPKHENSIRLRDASLGWSVPFDAVPFNAIPGPNPGLHPPVLEIKAMSGHVVGDREGVIFGQKVLPKG